MSDGRARYALGYPKLARRLALRELLVHSAVTAAFGVAPALASLTVFRDASRRPWETIGASFLALVAAGAIGFFLWSLATRFWLRLVPRFDPPLPDRPDTYSFGRAIAPGVRALDRHAAEAGVRSLSSFGAGEGDRDSPDAWFDCDEGLRTVRSLLRSERGGRGRGRLVRDLERIEAALSVGAASGARFRLVLVTGNVMNGQFFEHLRTQGF